MAAPRLFAGPLLVRLSTRRRHPAFLTQKQNSIYYWVSTSRAVAANCRCFWTGSAPVSRTGLQSERWKEKGKSFFSLDSRSRSMSSSSSGNCSTSSSGTSAEWQVREDTQWEEKPRSRVEDSSGGKSSSGPNGTTTPGSAPNPSPPPPPRNATGAPPSGGGSSGSSPPPQPPPDPSSPLLFDGEVERLTPEQQKQKEELIKELTRRLSGPLADEDGNVPTGKDRPTAIEVDGPSHFYANSTRYTAYTKLKHRLLTRMGYRVLHVPYFEWRKMRGAREREEYMRTKLEEEPTEWLDPEDEKFYAERMQALQKQYMGGAAPGGGGVAIPQQQNGEQRAPS